MCWWTYWACFLVPYKQRRDFLSVLYGKSQVLQRCYPNAWPSGYPWVPSWLTNIRCFANELEPWFQTTASLIADQCRSHGEELYVYDIQVRLKISSKKDENLRARARAQMLHNYHLDLRRLHTNTTTSDDHSQLTGILDMVCPGLTRVTEKSTNAKPEVLDSCQVCITR